MVRNLWAVKDQKKGPWETSPVSGQTATWAVGSQHLTHTETPVTERFIYPTGKVTTEVQPETFSLGVGEIVTAVSIWYYCVVEAGQELEIKLATKGPIPEGELRGGVTGTTPEWHGLTALPKVGEGKEICEQVTLESGKENHMKAIEMGEGTHSGTRIYVMYLEVVSEVPGAAATGYQMLL